MDFHEYNNEARLAGIHSTLNAFVEKYADKTCEDPANCRYRGVTFHIPCGTNARHKVLLVNRNKLVALSHKTKDSLDGSRVIGAMSKTNSCYKTIKTWNTVNFSAPTAPVSKYVMDNGYRHGYRAFRKLLNRIPKKYHLKHNYRTSLLTDDDLVEYIRTSLAIFFPKKTINRTGSFSSYYGTAINVGGCSIVLYFKPNASSDPTDIAIQCTHINHLTNYKSIRHFCVDCLIEHYAGVLLGQEISSKHSRFFEKRHRDIRAKSSECVNRYEDYVLMGVSSDLRPSYSANTINHSKQPTLDYETHNVEVSIPAHSIAMLRFVLDRIQSALRVVKKIHPEAHCGDNYNPPKIRF